MPRVIYEGMAPRLQPHVNQLNAYSDAINQTSQLKYILGHCCQISLLTSQM